MQSVWGCCEASGLETLHSTLQSPKAREAKSTKSTIQTSPPKHIPTEPPKKCVCIFILAALLSIGFISCELKPTSHSFCSFLLHFCLRFLFIGCSAASHHHQAFPLTRLTAQLTRRNSPHLQSFGIHHFSWT